MMFDLMCNCLLVATIFFLSGLQRLESSVFFVVIFSAIFTGYSCIIQARCIFKIWISNNSSISNDEVRLKRIFLLSYLGFITVLFYLCYNVNIRFFSSDSWIISVCSIIWIPQIIHNLMSNELKSIPFISILIISVNRILFPLYLRVLDDSFFLLHKRILPIVIGFLLLILQQFLIYYQVKYGGAFFLPDFIKKYIISIKDQDNVSFYSKNEFFQYAVKNKAKFENYENGDCTICLQALLSPEEVIELKNILIKENIVILDEQSSKEYSNLNEESLSHNDSKLDELEVIENEKMDVKNMSFLKFNNNLEERKTPILTYLKENITLECIFMESKNLFNIFFSFHKYKTINKLRNKIIAVTNECNHSFHCSCLTDWLGTKMECPIDRKQIILDI